MRIALIAAVALALTGCAVMITPENSVSVLEASPAGSEQTYRNIMTMARACHPGTSLEAQYYPEARTGDILAVSAMDGNRIELFQLNVSPGARGSVVKMTSRPGLGPKDYFSRYLSAWMRGEDGGCPGARRIVAAPSGPYAK